MVDARRPGRVVGDVVLGTQRSEAEGVVVEPGRRLEVVGDEGLPTAGSHAANLSRHDHGDVIDLTRIARTLCP
jgi:hypothetical protein